MKTNKNRTGQNVDKMHDIVGSISKYDLNQYGSYFQQNISIN